MYTVWQINHIGLHNYVVTVFPGRAQSRQMKKSHIGQCHQTSCIGNLEKVLHH